MRFSRCSILAALAVALAAGPAGAQVMNGLAATCDGTTIGVSFSGTYDQEGPPLAFVWRRNLTDCGPWTIVGGPILSTPGQPLQFGITDTAVSSGQLYEYWLGFTAGSGRDVSNDGPFITVYRVYAGCGQVPVASGVLRSQTFEDGSRYIFPFTCPGLCYPHHVIWNTAIDLSPYQSAVGSSIFGTPTP